MENPVIAKADNVPGLHLRFDSTTASPIAQPRDHQHNVAYRKCVLDLGEEEFHGITEVGHVLPDALMSPVHGTEVRKERAPLHLRVRQVKQASKVLFCDGVSHLVQGFHVLL